VDGGQILVNGSATRRSTIPAGSTEARIYLRGGATHALRITVNRGSDPYVDRLAFVLQTNVAVTCDALATVTMVVPEPDALGRLEGTVDMVGEFELPVNGSDAASLPDSTGIIAFNGPDQNQRWTALPGTLFTKPSSGSFVLDNLVPTAADSGSGGYGLYAQMYFRTNHAVEYFRSPALGVGSNPPVTIAASRTVSVSNLFVILPGHLQGDVVLRGPAESPAHSSLFRGLDHAVEVDENHDWVPDLLGSFGVNWTWVGAEGVNRRAEGARFTAAYGYANSDFDGTVSGQTGDFQGSYDLVLGGLLSERTFWSPKYWGVTMSRPVGMAEEDYYSFGMVITDRRGLEVNIQPGETARHDISCCFSEVRLIIQSSGGAFYDPQIRLSTGSFAGLDDLGQPADYSVALNVAWGTPRQAAAPATRGEIVMYLPQGDYRLLPSVIYTGPNSGRTGLPPVDVHVGCRERVVIGDALHQITWATRPDGQMRISILSEAGRTYQLERATRLNPADWTPVGPPIAGTGKAIEAYQAVSLSEPRAFFRIRID
jgi:hypothetical protein